MGKGLIQFSSDKFSRFITKNYNWNDNKNSLRRKKFMEEEISRMKQFDHNKKKSSFVSIEYINNIIDEQPLPEFDNEVDFYKKDVRQKHFSVVEYLGTNLLYDR